MTEMTEATTTNKNGSWRPVKEKDSPGKLAGGALTLHVHTVDAKLLIEGRYTEGKPRIVSLVQFSKRAHMICECASLDDPFAHYQLVMIERELEAVRGFLEKQAGKLEAIVAGSVVEFERPASTKPTPYTLQVAGYGTTAARLIKQADDLMLLVLSLHHHHMLTQNQFSQWRSSIMRRIRGLLMVNDLFRNTGVSRIDLKEGNDAARIAIKTLLEVGFLDADAYSTHDEMSVFFIEYDEAVEYGPISWSR